MTASWDITNKILTESGKRAAFNMTKDKKLQALTATHAVLWAIFLDTLTPFSYTHFTPKRVLIKKNG
jgi:hypothetical protein